MNIVLLKILFVKSKQIKKKQRKNQCSVTKHHDEQEQIEKIRELNQKKGKSY